MSKDLTGDEKRGKLWELTRERNQVARDTVLAIQQEQDRIEAELQQEQAANAE